MEARHRVLLRGGRFRASAKNYGNALGSRQEGANGDLLPALRFHPVRAEQAEWIAILGTQEHVHFIGRRMAVEALRREFRLRRTPRRFFRCRLSAFRHFVSSPLARMGGLLHSKLSP